MIIQNLDFFEGIINDKDVIDRYKYISKKEDESLINFEVLTTANKLKQALKFSIKENSHNSITYKKIYLMLKVLNLYSNQSASLIDTVEMCMKENKIDTECLKMLTAFLNLSIKNTLNFKSNDGISRAFIYAHTLLYLRKNRQLYYNNSLKIANALVKGFDLHISNEFDEEENRMNMAIIKEEIKNLR